VRDAAVAAGFRVESSDLLRNPADDLSRGVFVPEIRGKTDRFLLKLTKPAPAP
jgi:predicted methyltransferase